MSKILTAEDFDAKKIKHDKMRVKKYQKSGNESKVVRITYASKDFYLQIPLAEVEFGLSCKEKGDAEEKDGKKTQAPKEDLSAEKKGVKYSLQISFDAESPELELFKNKMIDFDEKNIDHIVDESQEWWNKKFSRETVMDTCYGYIVKRAKEGNYADKFSIKLGLFNGKPNFDVYDENSELIKWVTPSIDGGLPELDWSWAKPKMKIEAIVKCEGFWIVGKAVYCTFEAVQLRVHPPTTLPPCAFDRNKAPPKNIKNTPDTHVDDDEQSDAKTKSDLKNADDVVKKMDSVVKDFNKMSTEELNKDDNGKTDDSGADSEGNDDLEVQDDK